jgi:hypothetical protein
VLGSKDFDCLVRELANLDVSFWIRAGGSSMRPSIPPGTEVRLVPVGHRQIRVGDVVLARAPSGLHVLHRVRHMGGHRIQLQGDANVTADPLMTDDSVLAVADAVRIGGEPAPIPSARMIRATRWVLSALAPTLARQTGPNEGIDNSPASDKVAHVG